MRRSVAYILLVASLSWTGCSYNKQCFGNGVCKITKDGKTTWEGPPDKVAEMQAKEAADEQRAAEMEQAYKDAPKRAAGESVRVLALTTAASEQLSPFVADYGRMLEQELRGSQEIELVAYQSVKSLVESSGKGGLPGAVDAELTRVLRDGSGAVDFVLLVSCGEKTKTGVVRGGGGSGVAQVVNVEFSASLSSVYEFDKQTSSKVGKSNTGIAVAGVGKGGKGKSGEIKGKRKTASDLPAVQGIARWAAGAINKGAPKLPSIEAAKEIRIKYMRAALNDQLGN